MKLSEFDFVLPPERIAQHPAEPRDGARLLEVLPAALADRTLRDLPGLLRAGDLLVSNDTRVIKAQLSGMRGAARIDVTLHKRRDDSRWDAFARPAKKLSPGDALAFAADFGAEVEAKGEGGEVTLRFDRAGTELMAALDRHGRMPLPPYIKRATADPSDERDYQTVFADRAGAVAAPTAGLHFTPRLLAALDAAGVRRAQVTLHVGAGTFLPVKTENVDEHRMHAEWAELPEATAAAIAETRARGGRVVAIGTTSLRTLEGVAALRGAPVAWSGDLDLFIRPGFTLPRGRPAADQFPSAEIDAVHAGRRLRRPGAHARGLCARHRATGYRFFSYGDACLLHRGSPA
jgi:S-adenosylmethionine:tRNA ribosyltransferase-isomerase